VAVDDPDLALVAPVVACHEEVERVLRRGA
jgi:hypothetical protein